VSAINNDKHFVWVWIPKNAGSSIYQKLIQYGIFAGNEGAHEQFSELEAHLCDVDKYFKWAFVRNPYSRIASAYYHLVKAHNFHAYGTFEEFVLNDFVDKEGRLSVENSKVKTHSTLHAVYHLQPQSFFLRDHSGKIEFDFIGRVENISEDWKTINKRLGLRDDDKLEVYNRDSVPFLSPEGEKVSDYSKHFLGASATEMIKIINEIYKDDFENFGYEMLRT
jgi:hypothetical protein